MVLGAWHNVTVSRTGREVFLAVDQQGEARVQASGGFSQLSLDQHLWLGGVAHTSLLSSLLPPTPAFKGCIQKVQHVPPTPLPLARW